MCASLTETGGSIDMNDKISIYLFFYVLLDGSSTKADRLSVGWSEVIMHFINL